MDRRTWVDGRLTGIGVIELDAGSLLTGLDVVDGGELDVTELPLVVELLPLTVELLPLTVELLLTLVVVGPPELLSSFLPSSVMLNWFDCANIPEF